MRSMATTEDPRAGIDSTQEWRRELYEATPRDFKKFSEKPKPGGEFRRPPFGKDERPKDGPREKDRRPPREEEEKPERKKIEKPKE